MGRLLARTVGALALGLLPLGAVACGGTTEFESDQELLTSAGGGPSPLTSSASFDVRAAVDVLHAGNRLVSMLDPSGSGEIVQFLESFASDGQGLFALDPLGPASPTVPPADRWAEFSLVQRLRTSLNARYRDFAVRDLVQIRAEWSVLDLGTTVTVAGRSCRRVDVEHLRSGRRYELAIDLEVNLVLDQRELDAGGFVLSQVTYQTLDLDPDLSGVAWYVPHVQTAYSAETDFLTELGADVVIPTNPPAGYRLLSIDRVDASNKGDTSGPWLRVVYTNGVDPLFYVLNLSEAVTWTEGGRSNGQERRASGNDLRVLPMGDKAAVETNLPHGTVMAVGRVSVEELGDLVLSGFPE